MMIGRMLSSWMIAAGDGGTLWFPKAASTQAELVDWLYYFTYYVSVVSFVLIMAVMLWFLYRYRAKKRTDRAESQNDHSNALEIGWSIPPLIFSIIIFYFGAVGYVNMKTVPDDAYEIRVNAYKWAWNFEYPGGAQSPDLHLPVDEPVRLVMYSDDVIHSLFIPAFRVKQDVVPGRYTEFFVHPTEAGEYPLFCTEYCGTKHSEMLANVVVHPPGEFDVWLKEASNPLEGVPPEKGGELLFARRGCTQCHSVDGTAMIGPSMKNLAGKKRGLADGSQVDADENYIRTSILNPRAQVVSGYNPVMPSFQGKFNDQEIDALIAYIKSLKE